MRQLLFAAREVKPLQSEPLPYAAEGKKVSLCQDHLIIIRVNAELNLSRVTTSGGRGGSGGGDALLLFNERRRRSVRK